MCTLTSQRQSQMISLHIHNYNMNINELSIMSDITTSYTWYDLPRALESVFYGLKIDQNNTN